MPLTLNYTTESRQVRETKMKVRINEIITLNDAQLAAIAQHIGTWNRDATKLRTPNRVDIKSWLSTVIDNAISEATQK